MTQVRTLQEGKPLCKTMRADPTPGGVALIGRVGRTDLLTAVLTAVAARRLAMCLWAYADTIEAQH